MATSTYTDPAFSQLRAPAQDAAAVADVLKDPEIGGFTVTSMLDRPEYEIRRALDRFLAERGRDDLVVVYLSCHGVQDARGRLYFAATDTSKTALAATGVESAWLLDRLEDCPARRQVVILDCCFSGAFTHTKSGSDTDIELDRRLMGAGRGRVVLTASRASEYSYEGAPLPGAVTGRSVFTAALLDGIRTGAADRDGRGYIAVDDAYAYAADQVADTGSAQSPQRWLYGAEGEIILARNPHGATVNPAKLPDAVQTALDSAYPDIRKGAVDTLGAWLTSDDANEVMAAQRALRRIASQDSSPVAAHARNLLQTTNSAEPTKARAARQQTQQHTGERPTETDHGATDSASNKHWAPGGETPTGMTGPARRNRHTQRPTTTDHGLHKRSTIPEALAPRTKPVTPPQQRPTGDYQAAPPPPAGLGRQPGHGMVPRWGNKALPLTAAWTAVIVGGLGTLYWSLLALSLPLSCCLRRHGV